MSRGGQLGDYANVKTGHHFGFEQMNRHSKDSLWWGISMRWTLCKLAGMKLVMSYLWGSQVAAGADLCVRVGAS